MFCIGFYKSARVFLRTFLKKVQVERKMDQQRNRQVFFSQQNEGMLYGLLSKNFQQRMGPLNEKQSSRLERALEHYMSEVFQVNPTVPVQALNKEVLAATASDFNDYIQRQESLAVATPQAFEDTSNRFEQLQQDRQRTLEAPRPAVPEYVQPIQIKEDESVSALTMFEEAKKRRNMEMNSQAETQNAKRAASASQPLYLQDVAERPDPRVMYDRPLDLVVAGQEFEAADRATGNPTIARASGPGSGTNPGRGTLQQDLIIKQQDIQSYKETEYNLSLYSADRKWELDTTENRYNFSVNLYSGNPTNGMSIAPKATARFRNIIRIEFVKAIMPIENTDMIVRKITNTTTYDSTYLKNVFGYPYVSLHVDELDTNTYGTNNTMDNAFGILQYDANWTDNTQSMGFTSLIPKHMKCQRIYSPTPLSTLNKLSIRLQQPNGQLVNTTSDTLDLNGAFLSITADILTYTGVSTNNSYYVDSVGEYIWLDCKKWFTRFQVAAGDRIQIRNLSPITNPTAAQTAFLNFLQDTNGLMVVGTAYNTSTTSLNDGNNTAGYARFIIVRSQFNDPTTGSTTVLPFGGAADNSALSTYLKAARFTSGRLINLSHQTQLVFRIVTRDYDSTALVRPDNL